MTVLTDLLRGPRTQAQRLARQVVSALPKPAQAGILKARVLDLESQLARIERRSDAFVAKGGERSTSRVETHLRAQLAATRAELSKLETASK